MFIILMLVVIYLCVFSIVLVTKYLDIQKDIDTLYDNYSKALLKTYNLKEE